MSEQDQQTEQGEQTDTEGTHQADAAKAGAAQSGGADAASRQQTKTPGTQAGGYRFPLTEAQRKRLLEDGVLELSEEQYTGGVRQQIEALKRRAAAAERRLAEIAAAREAEERKALEEQERYKELYEKERAEREKERQARAEEAIRSRFLLAAAKAGVVDPEAAYVLARSLDVWQAVQVDDEGKVAGIEEAVKALVEAKPYLVSQQEKRQSVGAASNPAPPTAPAPKSIAEAGDELERRLRAGI